MAIKFVLWKSRTIEAIFNYIRDLIWKRVPALQIHILARERFPRRHKSTFQEYIDYARGMRAGATALNASKGDRKIVEALQSSQRHSPRFVRVGYTFEFIDPKRGGYRKAGFYTDVASGMTKTELKQAIQRELKNWLQQHYEFRGRGGRRHVPEFKDVIIQNIEGR